VYDNHFHGGDTGVRFRMGAQMLLQDNVLRGVSVPIETAGDSPVDGCVNKAGNDLGGGTDRITQVGTFTTPPDAYLLDATTSVIATVAAGAGQLGRSRLHGSATERRAGAAPGRD
jgi:pectate lyase